MTPDRFPLALLAIEGFLLLSEWFCWFPFNEHKNWTVLVAFAVVCVALVFFALWFGASLMLRRRFQFRIQSLLVLFVAVAVACSWFAVGMQQARRQREAIDAISKTGATIFYDYQFLLPKTELERVWLRNLFGVDFLSHVQCVIYVEATDADLVHLRELTGLGYLRLRNTQVSDAGLVHLKGLTNLGMLDLGNTQVTDRGLLHVRGLTSLQSLWLEETQVSDAGVAHLKGLARLGFLVLSDTQVTEAGVQELQQALPSCMICP